MSIDVSFGLIPPKLIFVPSFELENAVHEFIDGVYFDNEKFFIENLVVFWIDESQALGEI